MVIFLLIILVFSVITMLRIMGNNVVRVQYLIRSLIALLITSFLTLIFDTSRGIHTIALAAIPSAILIANYFLVLKKRVVAEILFLVLLAVVVYNLLASH
jgi:hypothetical protein